MPLQTSVLNKPAGVALAGMAYDLNYKDVGSAQNATRQLIQVSIDNATNGDAYTVTINGVDFSITADGSATATEIRDALKAEIDAGSQPVVTASVSTNKLNIYSSVADLEFTYEVDADVPSDISVSLVHENGQEIPFGVLVVRDDLLGDRYCRLPYQASDITGNQSYGVSKREGTKMPNDGGFAKFSHVPYMDDGRIWVVCEEAVSNGDAVYVRVVADASAGEQLGSFRNDADGGDAVLLPGARFIEDTDGAGLAPLYIRLPA